MTRWAALFGAAAAYGVLAEFLFRRFTSAKVLRATLDKMIAHALELPLFFDEPATVWRAQGALFMENLRLLRSIALPSLLLIGIFFLLSNPADRYLGHRPLASGESAVITEPISRSHRLPPGIVIETPGVHVPRTGTVSWRVRAVAPNADGFPYRGPRVPWMLWFAFLSTCVAAGISLSR